MSDTVTWQRPRPPQNLRMSFLKKNIRTRSTGCGEHIAVQHAAQKRPSSGAKSVPSARAETRGSDSTCEFTSLRMRLYNPVSLGAGGRPPGMSASAWMDGLRGRPASMSMAEGTALPPLTHRAHCLLPATPRAVTPSRSRRATPPPPAPTPPYPAADPRDRMAPAVVGRRVRVPAALRPPSPRYASTSLALQYSNLPPPLHLK